MNLHILAVGQSNSANHCGSLDSCEFGDVVFEASLHAMKDPVPGGSGNLGSVWPRLARKIQQTGSFESMKLTLASQGGTSISEWAPGGTCFKMIEERHASGDLDGVTHVVFQQGEKDTLLQTTSEEYIRHFQAFYEAMSSLLGNCLWIICKSSYRMGVTSDAVTTAQKILADSLKDSIQGPDLDQLGAAFRRDDTHFNDSGLEVFASELFAVLCHLTRKEE